MYYIEFFFTLDIVWGLDFFGYGLGEKLVVFFKDDLDFKRKIIVLEFLVKGYFRLVRLYKN